MVPPNNLGPDLNGKSINETQFRGMIRSLMYMTASRPGIQFSTCLCGRYQANPKESHLIDVKRIFRYLKGTLCLGLWYPKCLGFDLKGYSDSDYVGCNMDRKSTSGSGACQLLGGKHVCWSAKKQQFVAMSSAKAEYVAATGLNLFSNSEDQFEEEETEAMGEPTMKEYMTKTREYYGPGIARPKIYEKAHFELKGQFLKELRDNTFSGSDNEDTNEHIKKVLEIVDLFHIPEDPNETLYQAWEHFKELLLRCPQHYLMDIQEVILFYKELDVPTRQILDSKGAIPSMNVASAKKAIQDTTDHS
ncbi:hypothetical protein Tco_1304357 [Tanacetum coccineum]